MELSEASKRFKASLPASWQSIAEVSMKHKDYLLSAVHNLIEIYGDYADPKKTWESYLESEEYKSSCRKITKLSKLPEIDFSDILRMIEEEDAYHRRADRVIELKQKLESATKDEKEHLVLELGEILGVVPDCENGLFTWLVNFKSMTDEEKARYTEMVHSKENNLEMAVMLLADFFVDGKIEEFYPSGAVMTQPYRRYFYRGEYAFFGSSRSGLFRGVKDIDVMFTKLTWLMRMDDCGASFDKLDVVNHWGCSDIAHLALAQHYGLKTIMIDITSDLRTALFFACCKMNDKGAWVPLCNEDFRHRSSRKAALGLGSAGNSKYGILYRASREITDIRLVAEDREEETIIPVGYQPLMRCAAQSAYMLLATDPHYDMYQDTRFEKVRFRLTEDICNWIYEEMDHGKKIYPYEDIPDISAELTAENKSLVFSELTYNRMRDEILKLDMTDQEKTDLLQYLSDRGVKSSPDHVVFSDERIREINERYTPEYAERLINKPTRMRPMLHIRTGDPDNTAC